MRASAVAVLCGFGLLPVVGEAASFPPRFQETTVFGGLTSPTVVKFAPDGRVFVAEKSGLIKVYSNLLASTPTVFADLRSEVHDYWDRGLLGMELDPAFPSRPYVYVLYALDKNPGDPTAGVPTWGDTCPTPPGPTASGCPVLGRLSRLDASAPWPVQATEQVLLEGFPQQFPSHSVGGLAFGPDGALYVSGGEGANFMGVDYGQFGGEGGSLPGQSVPVNPLGDPPAGQGGAEVPPGAEGGALRSQSLRRPAGEPTVLSGVLLRIDPSTGAALPDNPLAWSSDANARRIVAYGFRNPFRFALRPGTREVYVGDVGWDTSEEVDRLDLAEGQAPNFGWPCYEGPGPQPAYQAAGLTLCQSLYAEGSARGPFFGWDHSARVVAGETCPTGTSSISGLTFYTAGSYPAPYRGALFFTDWARHCIWAMLQDASGAPDPTQVVTFAAGLSGGAVYLEPGPGGDIFYVDYDGGRIQRITYETGNQAPVARATANPTSGASPLLVQFDGSSSSDPEGEPLSYSWDLDGDGNFGDSTSVAPSWTFTTSGPHVVRLKVQDPEGASSTVALTVFADNRPPVATITSPLPSLLWKVGDVITFTGGATDPEEGSLPPSALRWTLLMHHCPADCHIHTIQSWNGISAGGFVAPDHEYPSFLELVLVATDSGGLSNTTSVVLQPQTVVLRLETDPPGLVLAAGSQALPTPFSVTVIVGSNVSLGAPSPQSTGGQSLGFREWSDGGAASHLVVAPPMPLTLRAVYRPFAELAVSEVVTPPAAVQGGRFSVTATIANQGPAAATGVQLLATLPAGTILVSSSPAAVCLPSGASLACALGDVPAGGATTLSLVLRPSRSGPATWSITVASSEVETNLADNTAGGTIDVHPLGDINGDGKADLLWQNASTGAVDVWLMNGTQLGSTALLVPDRGPDPQWRLAGMGDFDGDGKPDLVWRNQGSGANEIWLMNGLTRKAVVSLPAVSDLAWRMVGVADFNQDGWPDILWRHTTLGLNAVSYMQGTLASGGALLPPVSSAWQVLGIADLNGDGNPDLLWGRVADGVNAAWLLNGSRVTSSAPLPSSPDPSWRVQAVADLNGDGKPDLVFHNQGSGGNVVVFMDGLAPIGGAVLPTATDLSWALIGPR